MTTAKRITILGESPLVEEYASLCHNKGYEVSVRLNAGSRQARLPRGFRKVTKVAKTNAVILELTNISTDNKRRNIIEIDKAMSGRSVLISSSVTVTAGEQATWISRPGQLVGIGALPSLLEGGLVELTSSHATEPESLERAKEFATSLGKNSEVVQDSIGLVLPRILCSLANEAFFAMGESVATGTDIDTAMRLGTNYPKGPIEWAERIGIGHVCAVIDALHRFFGEDRYRVSPLLLQASLKERHV